MSSKRKAFTIVELLVVVTIILLLMGILMPALNSFIESARATKCASNLKQFGLAVASYLKDNDNVFPPHRPAKNADGSSPLSEVGTGKKIRPRVMAILGAYMEGGFDNPSTTDERQSYDSPIFTCPSVSTWTDERNSAYGYNYQFLGNARTKVSDASACINFPVNSGAVSKPTRTILMGDCMGTAAAYAKTERTRYEAKVNTRTAYGNHGYALDPPYIASHGASGATVTYVTSDPERNGDRSALDPRHNGRANCVFVDGHVEAMTLEQAGYEVASDGRVTHGYTGGGTGDPVLTATNRYFSGDFTNRRPPLAD